MTFAEHLVASTRHRDRSLTRPERASWLWQHLRAAIDRALSFVLMPDHLHLVAEPGCGASLRGVLSAFTARFGVRFEVDRIEPATTPAIAGRMMRYGFHNAVRKRLVEDPWRWPWSTLRDLGGAAHPVWTPLSRIASILHLAPTKVLTALTWTADLRPMPPGYEPVVAATREGIVAAVAAAMRRPEVVLSTR